MPILELPRFFTTNTGRKKARQFQYLNCFDVTESIFYCLCSMLLIIMKYVIHYYGVQIFFLIIEVFYFNHFYYAKNIYKTQGPIVSGHAFIS